MTTSNKTHDQDLYFAIRSAIDQQSDKWNIYNHGGRCIVEPRLAPTDLGADVPMSDTMARHIFYSKADASDFVTDNLTHEIATRIEEAGYRRG